MIDGDVVGESGQHGEFMGKFISSQSIHHLKDKSSSQVLELINYPLLTVSESLKGRVIETMARFEKLCHKRNS